MIVVATGLLGCRDDDATGASGWACLKSPALPLDGCAWRGFSIARIPVPEHLSHSRR